MFLNFKSVAIAASAFVAAAGVVNTTQAQILADDGKSAQTTSDSIIRCSIPVINTIPLAQGGGYTCTDGTKAVSNDKIVKNDEALSLSGTGYRGAVLSIKTIITTSECKGSGLGHDFYGMPFETQACSLQPITSVDYVLTPSADVCQKLGPILTFKKWQEMQKDQRRVGFEWHCDETN